MMKSLTHFYPVGSGWSRPHSVKDKKAPFAPRRAGLVETRFSSICTFHPVGPGWTEPKGDEDPCTICGAGLVETLSLPKTIVKIPPRKVRLWNLSKA